MECRHFSAPPDYSCSSLDLRTDLPSSSQPEFQPPSLRLRITAAAETIVRSGHPWVFADSVKEQNRPGTIHDLAILYDRNDKFLAIGLYDPDSPIRVRILHQGKPVSLNQSWWSQRFDDAVGRRQELYDDPQTTGFRIVNGESDGWPALVLDRYARTLVLKLYSAAWLPRLNEILKPITEKLAPERVVLRLSRNIQSIARAHFELEDGQIIFGPSLSEPVTFLETGLLFEADVLRGQKTGFFLDQRENRRIVERLSKDRQVLNAFSFSGGFSLYAARGGATAVTELDISPHALTSAQRNLSLNPALRMCRHEQIQTDAFDWLAAPSKAQFDLIILDPPSLAKRESERAGAIRTYSRLAANGVNHLLPGGILVACSCSAHVSEDEFFQAVRAAGSASGRAFNELQTTTHASDHPATFKEARYLKAIYLHF